MIMEISERRIILFGYADYFSSGKWNIHIFFENTAGFQKFNYSKKYTFILDIKKLPRNSVGLFEKIDLANLYNAKVLFLLHLCKNCLENFNYQ